ncbi:hypothetical protein [uncultured Gammaproteobacteria bacterium]|nr:hypothetical protein [uncultured Gammaproteobacteria bacterium]
MARHLLSVGFNALLWTKTAANAQGNRLTINIDDLGANFESVDQALHLSVRCIKTRTPIVFNGLTYEMVTSPKTGRVWLDRNLGATQVATSSNDTDAYGDLYQWGRAKDGHESIVGTTTTIAIATNLNPVNNGAFILTNAQPNDWVAGVDNDGALRTVAWADGGVNDICPAGFSVPTKAELKEDIIDAGITSVATAFSSPLKLPAAGYRNRATDGNGTIHNSGSGIFLWSRSVDGSQASYLSVINSIVNSNNLDRTYGFSVRCIKTQGSTVFVPPPPPPSPSPSPSPPLSPISFKGLTYEQVVSPNTDRVWLDRNIGATQVATSHNDSAAYGGYLNYEIATDNSTCPMGFGLPTKAELAAETTEAEVTKVVDLGTAFNSFLRIPAAGFLNINSPNPATGKHNHFGVGSQVVMWTGTDGYALSVQRDIRTSTWSGEFKSSVLGHGFSVRCVKD